MSWSYDCNDIGIVLFDACLKAGAPMRYEPGQHILEIGCCESDWLERADKAWPDTAFQGIDVRADKKNRPYRFKRNVLEQDIFPAESFDGIVSLSAMEHVGLGHYGDPGDPNGDRIAADHAWHWLKPGGWFYFDVPYDPTGYRVQGTKCRVYDDLAFAQRLGQPAIGAWYGYAAHSRPDLLVPKPSEAVQPFHYLACVFTKPAQGLGPKPAWHDKFARPMSEILGDR